MIKRNLEPHNWRRTRNERSKAFVDFWVLFDIYIYYTYIMNCFIHTFSNEKFWESSWRNWRKKIALKFFTQLLQAIFLYLSLNVSHNWHSKKQYLKLADFVNFQDYHFSIPVRQKIGVSFFASFCYIFILKLPYFLIIHKIYFK